eukprot:11901768-Alexandrium_andersonii.AAC.1
MALARPRASEPAPPPPAAPSDPFRACARLSKQIVELRAAAGQHQENARKWLEDRSRTREATQEWEAWYEQDEEALEEEEGEDEEEEAQEVQTEG